MSELERIRTLLGVPVPTYLAMLGARSGRRSLLWMADDHVDPAFRDRARLLEQQYRQWRQTIEQQVAAQAVPLASGAAAGLTIPQFASLLRISPFTLWRSMRNGALETVSGFSDNGHLTRIVTLENVQAFFEQAETCTVNQVRGSTGPRTSPLLTAFLRRADSDLQAYDVAEEDELDNVEDTGDRDDDPAGREPVLQH